jgi:hypothetical protein
VVWLAGRRTTDLERAAQRAAERLGLPLEIRDLSGSAAPDDGSADRPIAGITGGLEAALAAVVLLPPR